MYRTITAWAAAIAVSLATGSAGAEEAITVLVADGPQKYHQHEDTTPVLITILEKDGRFKVDHSRSTEASCADGSYQPDFSKYDVVVMNEGFAANPWPEATEKAFEAYMAGGGGMVAFHAANNCWPEWVEFNRMTGVGGWGGRNEKSGPYLYIDDHGDVVHDHSEGKGGAHGPQHEYQLQVRAPEHPVMKGLPATFKHGPDELYDRLRGPAENVTILATAYSAKDKKGTGRHEPMLMAIAYGEGRVFHTALGHHVKQIKEGSFVTTFLRGTEWAATGKVTIPVPEDFPDQAFE